MFNLIYKLDEDECWQYPVIYMYNM